MFPLVKNKLRKMSTLILNLTIRQVFFDEMVTSRNVLVNNLPFSPFQRSIQTSYHWGVGQALLNSHKATAR